MPGGAPVDRPAPAAAVLGDVRADVELAQLHHEVYGVIALVGTDLVPSVDLSMMRSGSAVPTKGLGRTVRIHSVTRDQLLSLYRSTSVEMVRIRPSSSRDKSAVCTSAASRPIAFALWRLLRTAGLARSA
jgi:hypothetical protein